MSWRTVRMVAAGVLAKIGIRTTQPGIVIGRRGAEADQLRGEVEKLTGRQVRLDILRAPGPQEGSEEAESGQAG